jgi:hypothetical protein
VVSELARIEFLISSNAERKKNPRKIVPKNTSGLKVGGPGRPKGRLNKVTTEVRAVAAALVDDPQYRKKLIHDRRKRRVSPPVETMLWYYAKGKPVERHEIATPGDFSKLSDEELRVELEKALLFFPSAPTTG